ncbi:hypothetical protein O6H91_17G043400 [Diphasiastrum complanatum]|nr:hypothetical protein O6H91_17G043400 [Diphasiastrum complanatum]KAJ7525255.1 hypothetical protein O6H91_17G043400 [Diphasiastrum complanatum]KAJ7525259.1 hypothetical protein O6H91_17G043400 [Diphasiastrum complanatum]
MVNSELQNHTNSEIENGLPKGLQMFPGEIDEDNNVHHRNGTVWTAAAHIITAVIGSGVLSLAWSIAQMGWIAGPIVLLFFAYVTYHTSILLADCYRSPDPVTGKRNQTYMDAIRANLGPVQVWMCGFVQYTNLWATAVGYTITAAISAVAIKRSDCFHSSGDNAPCHISNNPYMAGFGVVEIIFSQVPDFDRLWWLSIVAAIMSFTYSTIGLGLGIGKLIENKHLRGTITGISIGHATGELSKAQKGWQVLQSLGNIAFAYSFSMILIEIQDTLKSPPAENKTMKKATLIGVCTTTFFYMTIGCVGYATFGNSAPGNLLTGFGFYNPYWLVDFANACIVVHLVGAYQVYSQPLFAVVENWASKKWPKSRFIHHEYIVDVPCYGALPLNLFRLIWRTIFVIATTIVAMLLPFFNDVVGLVGAYGFWPLTVYFPIEMYINQKKIVPWTSQWIGLETLSVFCLLISIAAGIGSIEGIIQDLKHYTPFKTTY